MSRPSNICGTPEDANLKFSTQIHIRDIKPTNEQDAQLSQGDRAAGCVIVFAKSRTLELGDNDLRTL